MELLKQQKVHKDDYATVIEFDNNPGDVYTAINQVDRWWTENFEGSTTQLNDEFTVTFGETFVKLKVAELVDNQKVVWDVIDCHKHFVKNTREWVGTRICFEITGAGDKKSRLSFTHKGLSNALECFDICCSGWNGYLHGSLISLITTGEGTPDKKVR